MQVQGSGLEPGDFICGVAWYREWAPPGAWRDGVGRIRQRGFDAVPMCESSWDVIQRALDRFDVSLHDGVMEELQRAGLGVALGVDTVRHLRWVLREHPDIRVVDNRGDVVWTDGPAHCVNHSFTGLSQDLRRGARRRVFMAAEATF